MCFSTVYDASTSNISKSYTIIKLSVKQRVCVYVCRAVRVGMLNMAKSGLVHFRIEQCLIVG